MQEIINFFSQFWLQCIIAAVIAYLISSVNTSIIVTRIVMHKDIRTMGSGNAGFTNVLRSVGKVPAIITFVGDFLKGVISVSGAYLLMMGVTGDKADLYRSYLAFFAGLFCVVGHSFPIYYKFKGGKGVVTTASVMLMTDWRILVLELAIFFICFVLTKTISKCSITNAVCYPLTVLGLKLLDYYHICDVISPLKNPTVPYIVFTTAVGLVTGVLIIIRHKDNIKRILNGTEKKITDKKK